MVIGIDAHFLRSGQGGNETYTFGLIQGLMETDQRNRYYIFTNRDVSRTDFDIPQASFFHFLRLPKNRWARFAWAFGRAVSREKIDLVHAQYVSPIHGAKKVLTVHDASFLAHPQFFSKRDLFYLRFVKQAARRANRIIAISHFTKEELIAKMELPPEKIDVVYAGVSALFRPIENPEAVRRVVARYGIPDEEYLLCVSRFDVRKNLRGLIRAHALLKKEAGIASPLVLIGPPGKENAVVAAMAKEMGLEKEIFMPGLVPAEDLPYFYNGARVCIYPSFYEGFGLPVLEAMACGTPLITSNTSAMAEIASGAALLVDPYSVQELAAAMRKLLENEDERLFYVQAGLERAKKFSWRETAIATLQSYAAALGADR